MYFFYFYFCLIIVISSYAHFINIKRNISYDENAFWEGISKECIEEQNNTEYNECMTKMNITNYKRICSNYKTEKCQKFYNNPLDYFPVCKNEPKIQELYQPALLEGLKLAYQLECQLDEEGNLCPMALSSILNDSGFDVLDDTCKSKSCTDSAIKVYKGFSLDQISKYEDLSMTNGSFSYNEIASIKKLVETLESNECRSQHVTSNANYIQTNTSFVISLVILLILLF